MKRLFLPAILAAIGLTHTASATDQFYINSGIVTVAPQIDAINFVNTAGASFNISSASFFEPFDTSNTQNFTNRGSLTCSIGWRFDTQPANSGVHKMAANFRNHPSGTVTAIDRGQAILFPGVVIQLPSKLIISATNLVNDGLLTIDEQGLMSLSGKNVNLNRGRLQVQPLTGQGSPVSTTTNQFIPDIGVTDNYWGIGTNSFNSAGIVTVAGGTVTASSPLHQVQQVVPVIGYQNFLTSISASPATSFVNTNASLPTLISATNIPGFPTNMTVVLTNVLVVTNVVVQGAFVRVADPNVSVSALFYPSTSTSNLFRTIRVGLSANIPNSVTLVSDTLSLFLTDQLASETNFYLVQNIAASPPTFRPGSYLLSRTPPVLNGAASVANSVVRSNLLFDPLTFSNSFVTALFAGYSATAGLTAGQPPAVPGADITNTPGRIEINSDTLDLTRTRIRADGLVSVKGTHLVGSSNAVMDAFNLTFDLGSTNGNLKIQNLAQQQVTRFGGTISCWSGVWTNTSQFVITNNFGPVVTNIPGIVITNMPDPNNTNMTISVTNEVTITQTNYERMPITNLVNVGFHVLVMNASSVITPTPVVTYEFLTHSANVVLSDPLSIVRRFITDAQRFTIESSGTVLLSGNIQDWGSANASNLLYFTNNGTFSVPNEAHFGDDRPLGYAAFVNRGLVSAAGIVVHGDYFESSGEIDTSSLLSVQTLSGKMESGATFVGGDLAVRALDFKFRDHTHQSGGALVFTITNTLSDNGPGGGSFFQCGDGFHVIFANVTGKPQVGDLLGTTIETDIPDFASIPHTWPGDDRGVSVAGFANNLALGQLIINLGFDSEAVFAGAGASNAMYVDYLDIEGVVLTNLEAAIRIDPNLIIYFADSNFPAEQLDGRLDGHLRWVSSFAGPNSSVDVVLPNGQVIRVNRALRNSLIIDSDGDGLANGNDPSPFDSVAALSVSVAQASPLTLAVSWMAAASTVYRVEFTTNQISPNWQTLAYYTNNAAASGKVTVQDHVPSGSPQRYYRVSYSP